MVVLYSLNTGLLAELNTTASGPASAADRWGGADTAAVWLWPSRLQLSSVGWGAHQWRRQLQTGQLHTTISTHHLQTFAYPHRYLFVYPHVCFLYTKIFPGICQKFIIQILVLKCMQSISEWLKLTQYQYTALKYIDLIVIWQVSDLPLCNCLP